MDVWRVRRHQPWCLLVQQGAGADVAAAKVNKEKWTTRTRPPWQIISKQNLTRHIKATAPLKWHVWKQVCSTPDRCRWQQSCTTSSTYRDIYESLPTFSIWNVWMLQHGWPDLDVGNAFKQEWMYSRSGQGDTHCLLLHVFYVQCIEAESLMHLIGRLNDGIVQQHKRGQQ